MELISTNFNRRTSHAASCCEIRPNLLSEDQRANRLDVCHEMKDQLKTDPEFLSKIITGDESLCYGYDLETKQ